jgi:ketosteroid isomerase-like protein
MKGKGTMKNYISLFLILLVCISCGTKQGTMSREDAEQAVLAQVHKIQDRWAAGDPLVYIENAADDVTWFDDIAAQTRIDGLDELRNYLSSFVGKITPYTYELGNPKVQVYGDVAISTFHCNPTINGEPQTSWKATEVYRLINGKWLLEHAHWSVVKEQASS